MWWCYSSVRTTYAAVYLAQGYAPQRQGGDSGSGRLFLYIPLTFAFAQAFCE